MMPTVQAVEGIGFVMTAARDLRDVREGTFSTTTIDAIDALALTLEIVVDSFSERGEVTRR